MKVTVGNIPAPVGGSRRLRAPVETRIGRTTAELPGDPMCRRVLVPLDGSPTAEGILPFILGIARPMDLEVVLLCVVTPLPLRVQAPPHVMAVDGAERRAKALAYLATLAAELGEKGVRANIESRHGDPVTEIVATAQEAAADVIAMTTHGRSGLSLLLFGSVAQGVLRQSDIPVLLMRSTEAPSHVRQSARAA
jgi:nucleotide-binding universal stress UspA family protein